MNGNDNATAIANLISLAYLGMHFLNVCTKFSNSCPRVQILVKLSGFTLKVNR